MSAETGEPTPESTQAQTPGELLRTERERRSITLQQAADDMHLDTWAIEALEANRFSAFGAPVYARGHLRKYALLLGLTPERVLHRYDQMTDAPTAPTPIPASVSAPMPRERRSLRTPLLIVLALLALALIIWGVSVLLAPPANAPTPAAASAPLHGEPAPLAPSPSPAPASSTEAPAAAEAEASTPSSTLTSAPAAALEPAAAPASTASMTTPAPARATPAAATESTGQVRLRLEFTRESWTEIYDGEGKRLMFSTGEAGRVREVSGPAPLHVTLGAAGAVNAAVNGAPIVIPRRAGREAARFSIDAAGEVRPAARRAGE